MLTKTQVTRLARILRLRREGDAAWMAAEERGPDDAASEPFYNKWSDIMDRLEKEADRFVHDLIGDTGR